VIIEKDAKKLKSELLSQKKDIDKHLTTVSTQEEKLKDRALKLQNEVTKGLKDDKSN
jgi:chaperonin cofactor prefoldin